MRNGAKWMLAAAVCATALTCVGVGAAAAADLPPQPREYYPPQQGYYPPQQGYVEEVPPDYVYPAPRAYYAPPVAVVPAPIYGPPYYGPRWYGPRWYGPRFAYGHYGRGYRRW
jgi:hypothetical protein